MLQDLTVRTRYGTCDLVAFLRRDDGDKDIEVCDWEKPAAVVVFHARGWTVHRISNAVGLSHEKVQEVVEGRYRPEPVPGSRSDAERARRERRRSERIRVDDRWVHPGAPHGSPSSSSNWGCYCVLCSAAHAGRIRGKAAS